MSRWLQEVCVGLEAGVGYPVPPELQYERPVYRNSSRRSEPDRVAAFKSRETPHRSEAEAALLELVPTGRPIRVLDLGTGDGRLLRVLADHTSLDAAVGLDSSPEMLRLAEESAPGGWAFHEHDLEDALPWSERFDVIVSGLAVHHLDDDRKQSLFAEAHALLAPGGLFANLDLVKLRTARLNRDFLDAIGRKDADPSDKPSPVEDQLRWLETAGFDDVDCFWRWRGMGVLAGWVPGRRA